MDPRAFKDRRVYRVFKDCLEHRVIKVIKDLLVQELKAFKVTKV